MVDSSVTLFNISSNNLEHSVRYLTFVSSTEILNLSLKYFLNNMESHNIKDNKDTLELLWECCQIPDFVKKTYGNHYEVIFS